MICPECGSSRIRKGKRERKRRTLQQYKCNSCGRYFTGQRMEKKMKLIAMNVFREMLEERKETTLAMKLSEDSFGRLWDNKDIENQRFSINDESDDSPLDEIWDKY